MKCRISNRLALDINYDTQLVSGLLEMRDSGGFPTFPFHLSFSVSLILPNSVPIRDPIVPVSFPLSLLLSSFFHSLDTNLFFSRALLLLYRSEYIDSSLFATKNCHFLLSSIASG